MGNTNNTSYKLEEALNGLNGLRKDKRKFAFKRVQNLFFNYLKEFNHDFFYKDLIKSFFDSEISTTNQNRIIKELLNGLVLSGKIAKESHIRSSKPFLRVRALSCLDSGSYRILMSKNGFKEVGFFNWEFDKVRKIPKRVLIKYLPLGVKPEFDFDFSVLRQTKSRSNQKVLTNRVKSITLTQSKNTKICYKVLD